MTHHCKDPRQCRWSVCQANVLRHDRGKAGIAMAPFFLFLIGQLQRAGLA